MPLHSMATYESDDGPSMIRSFDSTPAMEGGEAPSSPISTSSFPQQLQATLDMLQSDYEGDAGILGNDDGVSFPSPGKVHSLVERYERLRESFLESSQIHGVFEKLPDAALAMASTVSFDALTDDGEDFPNTIVLQERQNRVVEETKKLSRSFERETRKLRNDRETLKERKNELRHMLLEFQKQQQGSRSPMRKDKGLDDSRILLNPDQLQMILEKGLAGDDDDMDVENVDHNIMSQEELLQELRSKKFELQAQLERLQKERETLEMENEKIDAALDTLSHKSSRTDDLLSSTLEEIEQENREMQSQVDQYESIRADYECRRLVMEEMVGIKVESIDQTFEGEKTDSNLGLFHVTMLLLHAYRLRVTLQPKATTANSNVRPAFGDVLHIAKAEFLHDGQQERLVVKDNSGAIALEVPPLDDIIVLAQNQRNANPKHGLRFLVTEAVARIQARLELCHELAALQQEVQALYLVQNTSDMAQQQNNQPSYQEDLVCQTREWKAVLRFTPDCPRVPGSVYLDQLLPRNSRPGSPSNSVSSPLSSASSTFSCSSYSSLGKVALATIQQTIRVKYNGRDHMGFSSPRQVIQAISEEIAQKSAIGNDMRMVE